MKTGNARAPAPVGTTRLAGDNRVKRIKTGKTCNLALQFMRAFGVVAVIAALFAHGHKPAPLTLPRGAHGMGSTAR